MISHLIDFDHIHTLCGHRFKDLPAEEMKYDKPTCPECQRAKADSLQVKNFLQAYWETQLQSKEV